MHLHIDIETYATRDLATCGVYKYAEDKDFTILLFAYAYDDEPVTVIDLACGETIPAGVVADLFDANIIKYAHNANFEIVCLSSYLGRALDPAQWRCTMIEALYAGLPASLSKVGEVLGLSHQKMTEGASLIRYFSKPCKPTKANGGRTRNFPQHAPDKWETYKAYNKRDVETERAIYKALQKFPMPDTEWAHYHLDQRINARGVLLDDTLIENAIALDTIEKERMTERAKRLTGLENPASVKQLSEWLEQNGHAMSDLRKDTVAEAIENTEGVVKEVLTLRQSLSKSSVKKYHAMKNVKGDDDRARGLIQFYGANRTGRYSGRLIQVQNLRRNSMPDLAEARELIRSGDFASVRLLYDNTADILSQLIRTAFIPKAGCRFLVSDFSAIEARVLAWVAGETWVLDAFRDGKDIYCETASQMFGVPVEKHGQNAGLRQKGKVATLACGYGGSVGALKAMGADRMGLDDEELFNIVASWRNANQNIVTFWRKVEKGAIQAINECKAVAVGRGICISHKGGVLIVRLPSGRCLYYQRPGIGLNRFGSDSITYYFTDMSGKWTKQETYGGKLTENIVQAIARDILAEAMIRLETAGYPIVMHVHDEVIIEAKKGQELKDVNEILATAPKWADGLPLSADGYACKFYQKD